MNPIGGFHKALVVVFKRAQILLQSYEVGSNKNKSAREINRSGIERERVRQKSCENRE